MADIQADGLRAASELLDRVLDRDDHVPPPRAASAEGDFTALFDAWAQLLQRFAAGLAEPAERGAVSIPIDSDAVGPPVRIEFERGESTVAEIWLHNGTSSPAGPLALCCGELAAADGTPLQDAYVQFEPDEVEQLAARSSRGVLVSLHADATPRPGVYRGTIQADGAPALWLPVEVAVEQ